MTNKHNVDPDLLFELGKYRLARLELELRLEHEGDIYLRDPRFCEVDEPSRCMFTARHADCALLCEPRYKALPAGYQPHGSVHVPEAGFASWPEIDAGLALLDPVAFLGYPGPDKEPWWDTLNTLPIARMANIASMGVFSNPAVKTADTILVSGLSFSGSSGSPVIALQKGSPTEKTFDGTEYRPARLVGIMSGHLKHDDIEVPKFLRHTGLSYFTHSGALLDLLEAARGCNFTA